ncbi:FAD-dependent oxidoreductase [Haloferula sp. BvORR071]|uniref:dihydrolipoyl dehydrogenase family protein n=1 Tax=Haloferula sp. BvORR071 TaxID=1396141 RepID=UPI0005538A50|nr:FAD-dependent oxidoreductase [Haloferula sp. BvORR071]
MNTPAAQVPGIHEDYDVLVLGCGEGGKFAAWSLARAGQRVAVIERKYIGGSCPNIACLPSKNVIHSAKVASLLGRGEEFGVMTSDPVIDMSAVRERKRKMVTGLVEMHLKNFETSGTELIFGSGQFVEPKVIQVTSADGSIRLLRGKKIIISTGSRARVEPLPGMVEAAPLTHIELLELDTVPEHLVVLGGGFVGLELAQAMRRFGSRVTIIDRNPRLAPSEDEDVSAALQQLCADEGIPLVLKSVVTRVEGRSGDAVKLTVTNGSTEDLQQGTHLLVASGRLPNTSGIGLDLAGVEVTERGHIQVNERLETTAPDVFAVGDCAGSPHFTHIAFDDFRIVRDNILGGNRVTTHRQLPFCLFTDPEFARVGLSETEAKKEGVAYRKATVPMAAALRTRTLSETRGFMKVLVAADSDRILGITVFGVGAGEIMAVVQVAILAGLPYTVLRDAVFVHPTLPEGLIPLFTAIPPLGTSK